jgi:hypothetical protein
MKKPLFFNSPVRDFYLVIVATWMMSIVAFISTGLVLFLVSYCVFFLVSLFMSFIFWKNEIQAVDKDI